MWELSQSSPAKVRSAGGGVIDTVRESAGSELILLVEQMVFGSAAFTHLVFRFYRTRVVDVNVDVSVGYRAMASSIWVRGCCGVGVEGMADSLSRSM